MIYSIPLNKVFWETMMPFNFQINDDSKLEIYGIIYDIAYNRKHSHWKNISIHGIELEYHTGIFKTLQAWEITESRLRFSLGDFTYITREKPFNLLNVMKETGNDYVFDGRSTMTYVKETTVKEEQIKRLKINIIYFMRNIIVIPVENLFELDRTSEKEIVEKYFSIDYDTYMEAYGHN